MNKLAIVLVGAFAVATAACSQKSEQQATGQADTSGAAPQNTPAQAAPAPNTGAMPMAGQGGMPAAHPGGMPMQTNAMPPTGGGSGVGGEGKVLETMHASSYTYMNVDTGGKKIWIATNAMQVNNGDTVRWRDGAPMKNFTSNALHRTFDEILFVSFAEVAK